MPPVLNFAINIWDTSGSSLCPPGEKPAWRWAVTVWKEGWCGRRTYKEGCEETLSEAFTVTQAAVRNYGMEN
jgi:hypothetical protein